MIRSSERQSYPDADNMEGRDLGWDVIANFQSQSDAFFKPPIQSPAVINRGSDAFETDQHRISAGYERYEFTRFAGAPEIVRDIGRYDTYAIAQSPGQAKVADFAANAESFVNQPVAASADMK